MGYDGSYVTEYNVQYSDDGENWMSAFGGGGFANTDGASSYTDPVSGEVIFSLGIFNGAFLLSNGN